MWEIFKDTNDYNEKTIIGFMSFAMMVGTAVLDLVMTAKGTPIQIKEYIYTSFVTVTLGSFGVAGLERFSGAAKVEAEAVVRNESADFALQREARATQTGMVAPRTCNSCHSVVVATDQFCGQCGEPV